MQENKQQHCIAENHPSLAGHFPDNPIVPGVLILHHVQQQLLNWLPNIQIKTLSQAKFLHPLTPNEHFVILLQQVSATKIKFTCMKESQLLVSGLFIVDAQQAGAHV
ncbi:MAG: hypothetical protein GQ582_12740 [Methyloprofundus sp.]|nr:hypothetical protein [Methyloprofundus sp.]